MSPPAETQAPVLLLHMPFGAVRWPSLGVGNLKAVLTRAGIGCDVRYFSIEYARQLGAEGYTGIAESSSTYSDMLGEWIFTSALFGADARAKADYLTFVRSGAGGRYLTGPAFDAAIAIAERAYDDAPAFIDACAREILARPYAIVGFSSVYQQNIASLALARRLKEARPSLRIAFGGANVEGIMGIELLRRFPFVDLVANGEAEISFLETVTRILAGGEADDVVGVCTRARLRRSLDAGRSLERAVRLVEDLDGLPYPDHDDFFRQREDAGGDRFAEAQMTFESSRGCWWGERSHCIFCGLNKDTMRYRSKNGDRAYAEIEHLHERYRCGRWQIVDDIMDMDYFHTLLPRLKAAPFPADFFYEIKSNLRKEQVEMLAAAGVVHIQPGIESLSTEVLTLVAKGVTASQNIQLLKWCRQFGVDPQWNLIWGFPGEPEEAYLEVARLMPALFHLRPPSAGLRFRLDRFSPLFEQSEERGVTNVRPAAPYRHVYPFDVRVVANLAYAFDYGHHAPDEVPAYVRPMLSAIEQWQLEFPRSALLMIRADDSTTVFDTRACASAPAVRLDGAGSAVLDACDARTRTIDFMEHPDVRAVGATLIAERLAEFLERRYVIELDGRLLSLVVPSARIFAGARDRLRDAMAATRATTHTTRRAATRPEGGSHSSE